MEPISLALTYRRSEDHVTSSMDDEVVLLDVSMGEYVHMNETAGRIWALLEEPSTGQAVSEALQAEYDVDAETCSAAVRRTLSDLHERGLIEEA